MRFLEMGAKGRVIAMSMLVKVLKGQDNSQFTYEEYWKNTRERPRERRSD